MKHLKKLTREAQKSINGGDRNKCIDNSDCVIGWCCNRMCVAQACLEP
ncbi:hypothetical protein [uncultured Chryseobacterium sp.]|nr:hypothetical protein [uncultured Chryseobacterium sp.]